MKWQKKEIELKDIPVLISQFKELIKTGNDIVEKIRCVYTLENDPVIYMCPLLDFIDIALDQKFISFFICQMVE